MGGYAPPGKKELLVYLYHRAVQNSRRSLQARTHSEFFYSFFISDGRVGSPITPSLFFRLQKEVGRKNRLGSGDRSRKLKSQLLRKAGVKSLIVMLKFPGTASIFSFQTPLRRELY